MVLRCFPGWVASQAIVTSKEVVPPALNVNLAPPRVLEREREVKIK